MRKRRTHEEFVKEVFDLVGNDYSVLGTFITTKIKVKIKHNICNYSYEVEPRDFFKGRRCSKCAGNKKKNTEEFKEEVYTLVKEEYKVLDEYINDKTKILIKHMDCGNEYLTKPNVFLNGHRCPMCSRKKHVVSKTRNKITYVPRLSPYEKSLGYLFPNFIEEWSTRNSISIYQIHSRSSKKVWWKCKTCNHEWETRVSVRTGEQKSGCPICNESKGEKRIREYLNDNNISFIPQKEFDNLLGTGGGNLSYDFYLPSQNLLIEYQGQQHEKYISMIHLQKDNFQKQLEHDRRKREYAVVNDIKLLEIWYFDFNNTEEILKNTLIS